MIALDTSSFVAYLSNETGGDVDAVEVALAERQACLPPAVLAELLSDPKLPAKTAALFRATNREMTRDFLQAARAYLGTPWRHQGRVKGAGVDCVGLLVCAARDSGMAVSDVEGYDRMPVDRRLLRELDRQLHRVADGSAAMRAGDVLAFSWSGYPYHVAILTQEDPPRIMHAWAKAGAVVENQLHDTWRRRIAGVWRAG